MNILPFLLWEVSKNVIELNYGTKMYLILTNLVSLNIAEFATCFLNTLDHAFFSLANPVTGVVVLLVGLVCTFRVTNLVLHVSLLVFVVRAQTVPVGPLSIRVNVHLDDSILDSFVDFIVGGS
jgi:hypothetical protein